jgi:hypothetical protein
LTLFSAGQCQIFHGSMLFQLVYSLLTARLPSAALAAR